MRDDDKIDFMMNSILNTFQEALQEVGISTLNDYEQQMEQMDDEQKMKFLAERLNNPFTQLKKALLKLETEYEEFKASPIEQEKVMRMFEALVNQLKAETTNDTEESDDTEDDSTKH